MLHTITYWTKSMTFDLVLRIEIIRSWWKGRYFMSTYLRIEIWDLRVKEVWFGFENSDYKVWMERKILLFQLFENWDLRFKDEGSLKFENWDLGSLVLDWNKNTSLIFVWEFKSRYFFSISLRIKIRYSMVKDVIW